jgi:hypothetical protein
MKEEIHSAICSCGEGMAQELIKFMFALTMEDGMNIDVSECECRISSCKIV